MCATRATICDSPAASQKFADLAIVWLMLAALLEEQRSEGDDNSKLNSRDQR